MFDLFKSISMPNLSNNFRKINISVWRPTFSKNGMYHRFKIKKINIMGLYLYIQDVFGCFTELVFQVPISIIRYLHFLTKAVTKFIHLFNATLHCTYETGQEKC